ncbi:hypothetical protein [Longispora albida]|uniref:hypothetical protein n=1 Tax=Longispora albida TaxID=203523 RepID=UPI00039CE757|nr:hypothetical protein [Longispora albida]
MSGKKMLDMGKDTLAGLVADITRKAKAADLLTVPTTPEAESGFFVELTDDELSATQFLELARASGARLFYTEATPFSAEPLFSHLDPGEYSEESWSAIAKLRAQADRQTGKICHVELAFVAGSVLHSWTATPDWFTDINERLTELEIDEDGDEDDDEPNVRARAQADAEGLAHQLADIPAFRPIKFPARLTMATDRLPELRALANTGDPGDAYEVRRVVQRASELVMERRGAVYEKLRPAFPELAQLLAADPAWVNAGRATLRKEAAELFLARHADGYPPTELERDRLMDMPPLRKPRKVPEQSPPDSIFD